MDTLLVLILIALLIFVALLLLRINVKLQSKQPRQMSEEDTHTNDTALNRMTATLEVIKSTSYARGKQWALERKFGDSKPILIGRANDVDIQFRDDIKISRRHARLVLNKEHLFQIEVIGKNGAWVDEQYVTHIAVLSRTQAHEIRLGDYTSLKFEYSLPEGGVLPSGVIGYLEIASAPDMEEGKRIPITKDTFRVGRLSNNDLSLPSHTVSGIHFEIYWNRDAGSFYVRDLHSMNGTQVNGAALSTHGVALAPNKKHEIQVASSATLTFEYIGDAEPHTEYDPLTSGNQGENAPIRDTQPMIAVPLQSTRDNILLPERVNATLVYDQVPGKTKGEKEVLRYRTFRIGREIDNELVINQTNISRVHAKLYWQGRQFYLEDLRSSDGTYLNDDQISPTAPRKLETDFYHIIRLGHDSKEYKAIIIRFMYHVGSETSDSASS
jgi:pSer/pThr/pTyr-binding forkhead associated (FHA) protein